MKKNILLVWVFLYSSLHGFSQMNPIKLLPYPEIYKVDSVHDYFGTLVPDPYKWLENDQSEKRSAWIADENKVTQNYLSQIPFRDSIRARLEKLWNYVKYSAPFKEGDYTYFYKNNGLQNQSVLYRQLGNAEPSIFLDPNGFSKDGTTSLAGISFTKDGSLAAYQISEGGSDWRKVIILKTSDGSILEDTLKDVKFSGLAWRGNEGFYYHCHSDQYMQKTPYSNFLRLYKDAFQKKDC